MLFCQLLISDSSPPISLLPCTRNILTGIIASLLPFDALARLPPSIRVRASALRLSALGHFCGDHIAFLDIFVAIFFIQNHDVRKRPDNQPLWLSAAGSDPRAALRASRFALRRCRSAFSACFQRSVCRDIKAPVSGIVSREESYAQGGKAPSQRTLARRYPRAKARCCVSSTGNYTHEVAASWGGNGPATASGRRGS